MDNQKVSSQNKRSRQASVPPGEEQTIKDGDSLAKKPREQPLGAALISENPGDVSDVEASATEPAESSEPVTEGAATVAIQPAEAVNKGVADDSNIGNESDSDLDYDDLDELVVQSDAADDFMDDDDGGGDSDSSEDDHSVASATTTMSTSSVGSNTPSLVGESLESVSLGEGARRKHNWVILQPNLTDSPALRRSLFSNVPPTINFMLHNEISAHQLTDDIRRLLKWRLSNITPAIVKKCAGNSGFRLMRRTCADWTATWGKHMKSVQFKEIKEGQKINHFPGTFNIGRKDKLWKNYHRLMLKFGKSEFGFLPRTFILPTDTKLLRKVWERRGGRGRWIVKPPALARGIGIGVVNKWSQIPKTRPLVVQRYIARPYLINGTKFDLRLYVLLTGVNPLRIYLYDDGLVRFASNKYTNDSSRVGDVFTHLTNYSINKNSSTYTHNEDSSAAQGHKWTLKSLWRHFDALGIDHTVVWEKIKDLMIKTILSAETPMSNLFHQNVASSYSCFELFGFDILLDSKLQPWLIEVNISPSLHSSSSLDLDVKSPLATEVFNMARYHIPNRIRIAQQMEIAEKLGYKNLMSLCHEKRLYVKDISKAERAKHDAAVNLYLESKSLVPSLSVLDNLTPDDARQLVIAEDELATSRRFQRIFPTKESHSYFKYLDKPRYYNLLLSAWEQRYSGLNREAGRSLLESLCLQKHHLKVPANVYVKKTPSGQQAIDISGLAAPSAEVGTADSNTKTDTPAAEVPDCNSSDNKSTAAATTSSSPPTMTRTARADSEASSSDSQESIRLSAASSSSSAAAVGAEPMDWGDMVTPSPRGTPEHRSGDSGGGDGGESSPDSCSVGGGGSQLDNNSASGQENGGTPTTCSPEEGGRDDNYRCANRQNVSCPLITDFLPTNHTGEISSSSSKTGTCAQDGVLDNRPGPECVDS